MTGSSPIDIRRPETGRAVTAAPDDAVDPFVEIAPVLQTTEKRRLALKKQFTRRLVFTAIVTAFLMISALIIRILFIGPFDVYRLIENEFIFLLPYGIGGYLLLWSQIPRRQYVRSYKKSILPTIARGFGQFFYEPEGGVCIDRFKDRGILPPHDVYKYEDLFKGHYRNVEVEFCETRFYRAQKGERKTVNVFRGVVVLLTMNKNFKGTTVVRRDAGTLGNWLRDQSLREIEAVNLEDPMFEEQFEVYSDNQIEARYLLTPAFMTRLMTLSKTLGSEKFEAAFYGAQLLIVLPPPKNWRGSSFYWDFNLGLGGESFGMFEPKSIFTSAYETDGLAILVHEFKSILSIVDVLKLHERTRL